MYGWDVTDPSTPTIVDSVVLDISEPASPRRLSHFAEGLTGGVHNTWIVGDLVYAVHYGTRALHIIDISEPEAPHEVGR